ncbi:hypothetical protein VTN00DRAFT_572 [Thermoascus crustaceus]|uniref:uncharacterized protein n=1 Tax=Thermoascus crustaceus TaxID=5088 RepID=UPI003743DFA9
MQPPARALRLAPPVARGDPAGFKAIIVCTQSQVKRETAGFAGTRWYRPWGKTSAGRAALEFYASELVQPLRPQISLFLRYAICRAAAVAGSLHHPTTYLSAGAAP